ncbi:MAG: glycerol-3-phosphate dehydrogenase [Alphaproteobacteria bacterium]|nr:glycerol-3-phosphate dehydrogenase [Alphaproteobacteria bacterium]
MADLPPSAGPAGEPFDLFVIGGGINGVGIARDAAGRGLSVALAEREDLASGTSSASSKLVHGGLRYLEHYEFRLVREALAERERLMAIAPHLVRPLRFVMPLADGLRPAWQIRLGLFLYDRLGGRSRSLPGSRRVDFARSHDAAGVKAQFRTGFSYFDCRVDDARLVIANARDAADRGALIMTRSAVVAAERAAGHWIVTVRDAVGGAQRRLRARGLVNTAGPWVAEVAERVIGMRPKDRLRLVKGSHVVVPRLYRGEHAFILQNNDGRVVFVIPFEERFSLIGTTEVEIEGRPGPVAIAEAEIAYLRDAVGAFLDRSFRASEIVWSWSGIRPLHDDGSRDPSAVTRDYVFELDGGSDAAPLLSVFGGKITTYRRLAEQALEKLGPWFPRLSPAWTAGTALPGGALGSGGIDGFIAHLLASRPGLPPELLRRLALRHGSGALAILDGVREPADLGIDFGGGLTEREVEHLVGREWARTVDDVIWRRSKLGLQLTARDKAALGAWLEARGLGAAATPAPSVIPAG